jgi:hypothetical protein
MDIMGHLYDGLVRIFIINHMCRLFIYLIRFNYVIFYRLLIVNRLNIVLVMDFIYSFFMLMFCISIGIYIMNS